MHNPTHHALKCLLPSGTDRRGLRKLQVDRVPGAFKPSGPYFTEKGTEIQTGKDTGLSPGPSRPDTTIGVSMIYQKERGWLTCAAAGTTKPQHICGPNSLPPTSHEALETWPGCELQDHLWALSLPTCETLDKVPCLSELR